MDLLQIALIFLIILLSIFLSITGIQVFFILKDLKKALDKLNRVLNTTEEIAEDIEKPAQMAANVVTTVETGAKILGGLFKKNNSKPKSKRFYKKML